tara:strand:+ start:37 stop:627 length:591 start_codon:yes stop_codon:yes gene_type:complete
MGKYGEFEVVGYERRKCKRTKDPNADEEGMREYSILRCPHCHSNDIEIATANLKTQKRSVIRDHMLTCPSYMGERPPKRNKTVADSSTAMVAELKAEVEVLEQKMAENNQETEEMKRDVEKLQHKTMRYADIFAAMAEEPVKIDQSTQTPNEWEKPNTTSPFFSRFATRIQDENAKLREQIRDLQRKLGDSDGILV